MQMDHGSILHGGSLAADLGVDAVKFQTHIAKAETLRSAPNPTYFKDETRFEYFERTAFSLAQHRKLRECAEECGVELMSSPFSMEAVDLLEEVEVRSYKVASGEITNHPLLIRLANTGKRIILSSGMSSWAELDEAISVLRENRSGNLVLLQCTSEYPCPPEHAGVNVMQEMASRYGISVGFSDHTSGSAVAVLAACRGACLIEKHLTFHRSMYGSDARNASTPEEFAELVEAIRAVQLADANPVDKDSIVQSLGQMKVAFEKSIVSATELPEGHVLQECDLAYKKPGDGISARRFKDLVGRRLRAAVSADHSFVWDDFSSESVA
jgi:N-acetylneuraminate synthase